MFRSNSWTKIIDVCMENTVEWQNVEKKEMKKNCVKFNPNRRLSSSTTWNLNMIRNISKTKNKICYQCYSLLKKSSKLSMKEIFQLFFNLQLWTTGTVRRAGRGSCFVIFIDCSSIPPYLCAKSFERESCRQRLTLIRLWNLPAEICAFVL